jgi:hypothetical protein
MIKRLLITATALFALVGFVGSTIAAPMADAAATTTAPAKKKTTNKKSTSTKKKPAKKTTTTPAPKS